MRMIIEKRALRLACEWLDKCGECKFTSRAECERRFRADGACVSCLANHFISMAKNIEENTMKKAEDDF